MGEPVEGVADIVGVAGGEEEVDGGAAVAASVAVPALVPVAGGEDAERGCPAGLGVVRVGAGPHPDRGSGPWAEELVGEGLEVDPGEDGVAVMPHRATTSVACCGVTSGPVPAHALVGVDEVALVPGEVVLDDGALAADEPQRPALDERADPAPFGVGEPEGPLRVVELFGVLAEDDLGVGVGEQPGGDLGLGGAVGGLGGGVGDLVGDLDVGDAEGCGRASGSAACAARSGGRRRRPTARR